MTDLVKQITSTQNPHEIEKIAKKLSLEDVKALLELIEGGKFQEGLLPLIKGMPKEHFAIFADAPIFQKLAHLEPMQKKLRELLGQFNLIYQEYKEVEKVLEECINELPLFPVHADLLTSVCDQIVQLSDKTGTVLELLDHILKLAWLSGRADLVEAFSELKKRFSELTLQEYSQPDKLLARLNSIYSSDEAASIEGLAALGINYVEDFKQLGLVFGEEIGDLPEKNLIAAIHDQLNAAGLARVGDLKKNKIYTKEHLFAYLKK